MKLILVPLSFLIVMVLFAQAGLGDDMPGSAWVGTYQGTVRTLYDSSGQAVCYSNGTAVAPATNNGTLVHVEGSWVTSLWGAGEGVMKWQNNTAQHVFGASSDQYLLYWDTDGVHSATDAGNMVTGDLSDPSGNSVGFEFATSIGMLGMIGGLMILAGVVGARVLGIGVSEISVGVIVKGTAFLVVWGVFSLAAYPLIIDTSVFGGTLYFMLTIGYALGVVNSFGHPMGAG